MIIRTILFCLGVTTVLINGEGSPWVQASVGAPWPKPQMVESTGNVAVLSNTFQFTTTLPKCDILEQAFERYQKIIFGNKQIESNEVSETTINELEVYFYGPCESMPTHEMDEQYELKICTDQYPNKAQLTSATIWGTLRGLETFSQLLYPSSNSLQLNCTQIRDYPRFSHRGFMVDTSRHFLPIPVIKENLLLMSMNKFNVFHWHIVDDQSFPFVSEVFPDLSAKGSWSPKHIYSKEDVQDIIQYAASLGIRVIAEFDSPGHTRSWGNGQPGLLTPCYKNNEPDGTYGPIDPTKQSSYDFVEKLFDEVTKTFPDYYVHLGGDEVPFSCWQSNPDINKFMAEHNITGQYSKLEEVYIQKLIDIVGNMRNKTTGYLVWQEVFDNKVEIAKDTVVHVWKGGYQKELYAVTEAGYHALLSSCWYLNYISYGNDWPKYYQCDPQSFGGSAEQQSLVMGGEACMWGEWVDATNIIPRTWPRASVVAEKLWSNFNDTQSVDAAKPRLEEHRCRLLSRGHDVQPLGPSFCPM